MTRFLVTGGAGFIGSHLVQRLVRDGHDVTVLDDFSSGDRENLAGVADRIRVIEGSITDANACRDAMRGATYVLHHAAMASVPASMADPARANAVNAGGTVCLLEAARASGVARFVNVSTCALYGDDPVLPKTEAMISKPLSPYAASKAAAELFSDMYHRAFGLQTVSLRYFNVFGARQSAESDYAAVIPKFIRAAVMNESPIIFGDGEQTRDFIHVDNVVEANLLACTATHVTGPFNMGSGTRTSVNSLWHQIKQMTGTSVEPRYESGHPGEVRDSVCSLERSHALLGYRQVTSFEAGLRSTIEFHRQGLAHEMARPVGRLTVGG